jgi:sodium/proline symporter
MTRSGALAGMITGAVTIVVVKNFISIDGEYFYELLPGFFLATIAIVSVSLVTKKPSEATLAKFDKAQMLCQVQTNEEEEGVLAPSLDLAE